MHIIDFVLGNMVCIKKNPLEKDEWPFGLFFTRWVKKSQSDFQEQIELPRFKIFIVYI